MATSDAEAARIFISYRRADTRWPAGWLAYQLAEQFGAGVVFQDASSIRPGDDFAAEIEAAVGACSVLLAVIGRQWLTAEDDAGQRLDDPQDWVRLEIEAALNRGIRVIPVLVDGARMPSASELPPSLQPLARRQAVAFDPSSFDTGRLVSVLEDTLKETGQQQTAARALESPRPAGAMTSRLLMRAIQDAYTLGGEAKTRALTAVIRAAAVAAPEQVGWLADEAEAAARSVDAAFDLPTALARIGEVVAAADPDRAETVARSIEDVSRRSAALAGIARVVAAADPDRAETIARSIEDAYWRAAGLAGVGAAMVATYPERARWLTAEAQAAARLVEYAHWRSQALARIAEVVAAADPDRAETIARSIDD